MKDKLFIPDKIKVGFQNRSDTYTKKLAYIIYYDSKGKLRKETSWEGWRDKSIEPVEVENTPHAGFVLNKDVQRSAEWFGSGRNMIRIYDTRGFEFEITTGNLMFILMTTDCLRRGLEGEFVYSWYGQDLILLPTNCEEYQSSKKYTNLQGKKISARNLEIGIAYQTKKMETMVYLGRYDWWDLNYSPSSVKNIKKPKKYHIFWNETRKEFERTDSMAKLARPLTDTPVSNYAELMDNFSANIHSSRIVDYKLKPTTLDLKPYRDWSTHLEKIYFLPKSENRLDYVTLSIDRSYDYTTNEYKLKGYRVENSYYTNPKEFKLGIFNWQYNSRGTYYYHQHERIIYTAEELEQLNLQDLYLILENGKEVKIEKIRNL